MPKALVLKAITGAQSGKRLTLDSRVNTIGSAPSNTAVLHDRSIEPRHAEIRQVFERWFIVPLAADARGISLNGMHVRSQSRLNPGDLLTLGTVTYAVSMEEIVEQEIGAPQASSGNVPRLGDYFVRRGVMTSDQVARTVQRQAELQRSGMSRQFGQIAYDMGFINRTQLDMALADQRSDFNDRFRD